MRKLGAPLAALALLLTTLASSPASGSPASPIRDRDAGYDDSPRRAAPALRVTTVANDLDHPWDVRPVGNGRLLFTQRDRANLTLIQADGDKRRVAFPSRRVWVSGETGLMGLAVDPDFAENRRIYTCQGWKLPGGRHDIRVIGWKLDPGLTAVGRPDVLLKGLPTTSGRHGGCRLLIARNGALLVGTGDAAVGRNPQSLRSFGGKTLRLDPATGRPWPTNPWAGADGRKRYIYTYGHRNVQGLAQRRDGSLWSVEHGSFRDDEINKLGRGRNFGWNPVPGYDESVPMTDHSLPGRQWSAKWRSGNPTIATSGAAFVSGRGWGSYAGTLAVACLAGERLMFVKFDASGDLRWTRAPERLRNPGRLRGVTAYRGSLLVTTSNGGGDDRILRVRPVR
ncbi:PQQ-dependent sugar dehydrogenase [Nocardioides bizhenqiangii]|uniref:PQQ-dependent sugar dehydrogenase n=1 Tax=Nocardioides bizhenqiangii TaxID=3095076 RepID=A0ABZ0ZVV6_9ACTN|nr:MULTISPECIES: PQQ-dependent sugar dehydrogenase [unclassified Nocardioides]MDZ5622448.1 PQQ-dependent sugar dehydrogenase [Nocardioides sp. HM23]WQQ28392.1 PQQ-dependent sugar dehydrogenase [Nocardioides sp. HM61]